MRADLATQAALVVGVALVTGYLGFSGGGYFPDSMSLVAVGLDAALILRVGLARQPFEGFTRRGGVAVAALGLFVIWTLISSSWSHAPGRAVLEANRALLYLTALVLFGSLVRRRGRLAAIAGGVALGCVVVSAAGFLTRTLPHTFPTVAPFANYRLSYPASYWNAAGILAALGIILCLGLSGAERVSRPLRIALVGAVPLLAATLVLTFSRGAIAAGVVGLIVLCAFCRAPALFSSLLAGAAGAAFACAGAYSASALAGADPTGAAAVVQGRHLAIVVGLSCLGSVALRAVLSSADARRGWTGLPPRTRRVLGSALVAVLVVGAVRATVAFDLPQEVGAQYHRFLSPKQAGTGKQIRDRLADPANEDRLALWDVAADTWSADAVHGSGAGTYQVRWAVHRPNGLDVVNAHSVYLGAMSDLGTIGLVLLSVCLLTIVGTLGLRATAKRGRRPDRAVAAALFAAAITWMIHAGVDWDWELTATTWWLFAAGGLALARGRRTPPFLPVPSRLTRVLIMVGIAVAAVLPAQVGLSQLNLNHATSSMSAGNCHGAVASALKAISYVGARAEPFEILGYCDARYGHRRLATTQIQNAINRDPQNWEYRYDMAIVRGATGLDPRRAARDAVALNPLNPLATSLAAALRGHNRGVWHTQALAAPLLVPGRPSLRSDLPRA